MTESSIKAGISELEAEYLRVKVTLYKNLFRYCAIVLLAIIIKEAIKAVIRSNMERLIIITTLLCFVIILVTVLMKLDNNHELIITMFFTSAYSSALLIQYYTNSGYFDIPVDSFNFAFLYAVFERLIVVRISKFSHRTVFIVLTTSIRTFIVRAENTDLFIAQWMYLGFTIFLDYDKEKYDQNFFLSYFHNKEQLLKFKNLIVQDIPESIIIMTQDLMKPLFVNNSFKDLVGETENFDARSKLEKFTIHDNLDSSQESDQVDSLASISVTETLLKYLESTMHQPSQSHKFSCNLSYTRTANGNKERRIFEAKVIHLTWDEVPAIAVVLHDITEQHTILSLKLADAHKDTVLATVSHELRTPLNGMLGMIQIMLKQVTDSELRHYLGICKNSGNLLLGLVNSILDLNQIRANKLRLNLEKVSVRELLNDIISLFKFQCNQKGLQLDLKMAPFCSEYITTDRSRLSQIFVNLVGNALKFTKYGGITISALESAKNRDYVCFCVEDTGTGIKDEDKKKLFQVFGKLEQSDKDINPHGVGLGLTISDKLARILGNKAEGIQLESRYGKGSKFSFLVKKKLEDKNENDEIEPEQYVNSFDLSRNISDERAGVKGMVENYAIGFIKEIQMPTPPHSPLHNHRPSFLASRVNFSPQVVAHRKCNSVSISKNVNLFSSQNSPLLNPAMSPSGVRNMYSGYVLVVDDNPLNIMIAEKLIASHGCQVKTTMDGQAAINIVMNWNPKVEPLKLILMDCQMPDLDGFMVTKLLRKGMLEKRIPEIPIVALTANDSETDRDASRRAGMCEHLSKPLNESELIRVLRKYMSK